MLRLFPPSRLALAAGLLAALTMAVFWPVTGNEFVNYDDIVYLTGNPHVAGGLSAENARWAFGWGYAANWHPLTWIAHQLDVSLFGLRPGGHHFMSLLLHTLAALLLFLFLEGATGAFPASLAVAALFSLHPLHVESVAWASERKDVLSGLFFMLALLAYLRYLRRPSPGRYLALAGLHAMGLAAKPMVVTLPLVLLLCDYWPLGRWRARLGDGAGWRRFPLAEKAPLLLLSAASTVVTIIAQRGGGALVQTFDIPVRDRLANAMVSFIGYLGKTFWPRDLSVFYPFPMEGIPLWKTSGATLAFSLITGSVLLLRRRRPFLATGWFWYLLMLLPVIGLVQVGGQAMADRYTYLPLTGVFLMFSWGVAEAVRRKTRLGGAVLAAALLAAGALGAATRNQIGYWRDSPTLLAHAIASVPGNWMAHYSLGVALKEKGDVGAAVAQYREALRIAPVFPKAHNNLGAALAAQGNLEEAEAHFAEAVHLKPDDPGYLENLGRIQVARGKKSEGMEHLEKALALAPGNAELAFMLGNELAGIGRPRQAEERYLQALLVNPDFQEARYNLGVILAGQGRHVEAEAQYRAALRLDPRDAQVYDSLGAALAAQGRLEEAMEQFRAAVRLDPALASARYNLGLALAASGRTNEAREQFDEARRLGMAVPDLEASAGGGDGRKR